VIYTTIARTKIKTGEKTLMKPLFRALLETIVFLAVLCWVVGFSFDVFTHYLALNATSGQPSLELATFMDVASPLTSAIEKSHDSALKWIVAIVGLTAGLIALWLIWKIYEPLFTHLLSKVTIFGTRFRHSRNW